MAELEAARLEAITKRFPGTVANESVDLTLKAGEIHALVGENGAGKTTLMRILYGIYPPDDGHLYVRGRPVELASPRDAIGLGIGMVHQHFMLVDRFTVAENIMLGAEGGALLDTPAASQRIAKLARSYGFDIDPSSRVEDLSIGQEQRVEILKALYRGIDILILDEPTAVLTPAEARDLFGNLTRLRDDGKSIVFISHKLDEVLQVADRITVLRRGKVVGETTPGETSKAQLAEMMVGREVLFRLQKPELTVGDALLEVENLTVGDALDGIDLEVRAGEILGIAGVEGNGQRELAEAVVGLVHPSSGTIKVAGREINGRGCGDIRGMGVGYVPEDRHARGLVLGMSVWENAVLGQQGRSDYCGRAGVLSIKRIKALAARFLRDFDVRARGVDVAAATLSGGNQQKLILARELETNPLLLVAHQPTRGLDVGAIEFVWKQLLEHVRRGRAVLLISTELDEIYELSDRILTIYEARITGEYTPAASAEELGLGMTGRRGVASSSAESMAAQ